MACLLREETGWRSSGPSLCAAVSQASGAAEATIREVFKMVHPHRADVVPEGYVSKDQVRDMKEH